MNEVVLNNELTLSYPDGFHEMSEEESYTVFFMDTPDRWSIWDTDRHVIISVQCNESKPGFLRKIVSAQDLAKRAEKATSKAYKGAGYSCGSIETRELCGQESCGFGYEYVVENKAQVGRIDIFTHPIEGGTVCYTLFMSSSKENAEENTKIYEEVLASMQLDSE